MGLYFTQNIIDHHGYDDIRDKLSPTLTWMWHIKIQHHKKQTLSRHNYVECGVMSAIQAKTTQTTLKQDGSI